MLRTTVVLLHPLFVTPTLATPEFSMLTIDDPNELLALERALLDLRFRPDPPNDPNVSYSFVLAEIHRRVLRARYELETDPARRARLEEFRN